MDMFTEFGPKALDIVTGTLIPRAGPRGAASVAVIPFPGYAIADGCRPSDEATRFLRIAVLADERASRATSVLSSATASRSSAIFCNCAHGDYGDMFTCASPPR